MAVPPSAAPEMSENAAQALPWRGVTAVFAVASLAVLGLWHLYGGAVFFEIISAGLALCFG